MTILPLFSPDYLKSLWNDDFQTYLDSGADDELRDRFVAWDQRDRRQSETQTEAGLIRLFFGDTWGYWGTGERPGEEQYTHYPQYPVPKAGQRGGTGSADLALGNFDGEEGTQVPQALCEFKDIKSSLDAPQNRQGNNRSPVKQCFDYLKYSFDQADSNSIVFPTWGVVTDMNEFRLYARKVGISSYQQFFIRVPHGIQKVALTDEGPAASFQRYLFQRLFHREMLLTEYGKSALEKVLDNQRVQEKKLEKAFYKEYQNYRETVFEAVMEANPNFDGTPGRLVQLTQRFLDRCIFILFCEDMGSNLHFPTNLLRDMLVDQSRSEFYSPDHDTIWTMVKQLFRAMSNGGPFPPEHNIPHFNGGLFRELPELENLTIPNRVFCLKGQGESTDALMAAKETLLYLSANYNFGASGDDNERTITLYALGRIFEQSITDLEYMEAEAEGVDTIAKLNKRKRNGVYYTPEWVTDYIVRETIGARLADARAEIGLQLGQDFDEKDIVAFQKHIASLSLAKSYRKARPRNAVTQHLDKLEEYQKVVEKLKILDPSCGSGAFLIQALNYLLSVRFSIDKEKKRLNPKVSLFDTDANIRDILSTNLYGVDLNPESIEITQLAMWLNTAVPGRPLSNLDQHIQNGNSLVGHDFVDFYNEHYIEQGSLFNDLPAADQEKVNVFSWETTFPEVFGQDVPEGERGFDCIVGNPPYVKLQNFRKIKPEESEYYALQRQPGGLPLYASAQTGNFDLYLLFIEKGLSLLNERGRMGYIAPSVWLKNEYGQGLRNLVKTRQQLDRWVDFRSYQVFDEATTYTALQFFTKMQADTLKFALTPDGDISALDWNQAEAVSFADLPDAETWDFMPAHEKAFLARLTESCPSLDDVAEQIFQGLITSKDVIYHLDQVGPGLYCQTGSKADGLEHAIEDEIMHPLVSGPDAKRFQSPDVNTFILFPYTTDADGVRLLTQQEMEDLYPQAWAYLQLYEETLRARENNAMDTDEGWWAFGRNQGLDKQELLKLGVAQTVKKLEIFFDANGEFYFNNVRVNGILVNSTLDGWFLLGVLNSPTADFVFRRTSIPKANGYFESNKQYIAPLPIPEATEEQKEAVATLAEQLQTLHTQHKDVAGTVERRFDQRCTKEVRAEEWVWPDVKTVQKWKDEAPEGMPFREKTKWAKEQFNSRLDAHYEKLDALLSVGANLSVSENHGEITLTINGRTAIETFERAEDAPFIAAHWRQVIRTTNITDKFKAETLVKQLRTLRCTDHAPVRENVLELDGNIQALDGEIADLEQQLNTLVYGLYGLTAEEIAMVEEG